MHNYLNSKLSHLQDLILRVGFNTKNIFFNQLEYYIIFKNIPTFFFLVALRPNAGHGLHIVEVSRSHTSQPVGLLWKSDQPVAETST